jgi:hypothetical protein
VVGVGGGGGEEEADQAWVVVPVRAERPGEGSRVEGGESGSRAGEASTARRPRSWPGRDKSDKSDTSNSSGIGGFFDEEVGTAEATPLLPTGGRKKGGEGKNG